MQNSLFEKFSYLKLLRKFNFIRKYRRIHGTEIKIKKKITKGNPMAGKISRSLSLFVEYRLF